MGPLAQATHHGCDRHERARHEPARRVRDPRRRDRHRLNRHRLDRRERNRHRRDAAPAPAPALVRHGRAPPGHDVPVPPRPLGGRRRLALPLRDPDRVRAPGCTRTGALPPAHRRGRGPLPSRRQRRGPAAEPAGGGREVGLLRVRGPWGDLDPGPPEGPPASDVPLPLGPGDRPGVRRGARRFLDPGHPGCPGPVSALRPRSGGLLETGLYGGRGFRPDRHWLRLPARSPHPPLPLLGVLAVDLAPAGLGGGLHPGPGGQFSRTPGTGAGVGPRDRLRGA